ADPAGEAAPEGAAGPFVRGVQPTFEGPMSVSGEHAGRESMELHILDAAKRLFARNGFDKVSMRDLAHEVGITPAALYHHFPNKSNLQVMALRHAHESTPAAALNRLRSEDAGRE